MSDRSVSERIRANVWAIALCFAAATGTAIAAGSGADGPKATSAASATKQVKKLKRKLTAVEARLAALEAKPAPNIPTIPGSLPPSGPAGGELAGTYPNPTIGPVSGLELLNPNGPTDGINFNSTGSASVDTNLYQGSEGTLRTDGSFSVGGFTNLGETNLSGYLRLLSVSGPPPPADCNASFETGRMTYNTVDSNVYVCGNGPPIAWRTPTPRVFQDTAGNTVQNALMFSVPELQVSITTDSSPASEAGMRVQNDAAAAGPTIVVGFGSSGAHSVTPQNVSPDIFQTPAIITNPNAPGLSLTVTCTLAASSNQICVGYLNG